MMEGKLNKKKNVFSPARSIILRLIQKSRRSMSTLMKWRAPREISEENLQRINLQLCSSRDVAYKSHVSEKYVDRNGPYTRCYLSAMSWKIFVFLFFFPFLRSTLRYAKVIIRVKWRKITFDKSAIRSFKQIWFSTRWNFRGEPKISMEKSEGNRESFATWIHPWNSHKSHLEFLFARNFSWLSQLFQSSGMIVSREREREIGQERWLLMNHSWSPWKNKFVVQTKICFRTNMYIPWGIPRSFRLDRLGERHKLKSIKHRRWLKHNI